MKKIMAAFCAATSLSSPVLAAEDSRQSAAVEDIFEIATLNHDMDTLEIGYRYINGISLIVDVACEENGSELCQDIKNAIYDDFMAPNGEVAPFCRVDREVEYCVAENPFFDPRLIEDILFPHEIDGAFNVVARLLHVMDDNREEFIPVDCAELSEYVGTDISYTNCYALPTEDGSNIGIIAPHPPA